MYTVSVTASYVFRVIRPKILFAYSCEFCPFRGLDGKLADNLGSPGKIVVEKK